MILTNKELLGIYLEDEKLQYASAAKGMGNPAPKRPGATLKPFGVIHGHAPATLENFLKEISRNKNRSIYLALPRDKFFSREMELPPMNVEDAIASIVNSLPIQSHLPVDEIYHDIHIHRYDSGDIHALIYYAPKKTIDAYLDIFRETGNLKNIKGIFPVSYGIGAWLDYQGYNFPMGLLLSKDETKENIKGAVNVYEFTIFIKKACLFSVTFEGDAGGTEIEHRIMAAVSKFGVKQEQVFSLGNTLLKPLPRPPRHRFSQAPPITENMGMAALSPALTGYQQISVDASPTRPRIVRYGRFIIPIIFLLMIGAGWQTYETMQQVPVLEKENEAVSLKVDNLNKRMKPLEEQLSKLEQSEKFRKDVEDFIVTKPKLFHHVNEIARLVPDGTWFQNLIYANYRISLKGESKDALKVIDALRTPEVFKSVKLVGSVSRTNSGIERFRIDVEIFQDDADTLDKESMDMED